MTALTRHSVTLMKYFAEESDNAFDMHYSGYDFVSEPVGQKIFNRFLRPLEERSRRHVLPSR